MTRFEKDMEEVLAGDGIEVLERRRAEIDRLTAEGKACRNGFRTKCIAQDVIRLKAEYEELDSLF